MIYEPPPLTSMVNTSVVLALFAAAAGLAAIAAIWLAVRRRDAMPIVVCIGALVCAFNEPIYDILGKIVYASDHPIAFTSFGRSIPWFLVVGYLPWVGLLPYLISVAMKGGVARSKWHWLAFGSFVSVVVVRPSAPLRTHGCTTVTRRCVFSSWRHKWHRCRSSADSYCSRSPTA